MSFALALLAASLMVHVVPAGANVESQATGVADAPALKVSDPVSPAEMEDLETIAAEKGISLDDAIKQFAWHDNFAFAVQQARKANPSEFTGAEIIGGTTAWIGFSGKVPSQASRSMDDLARQFGVKVQTRPNMGISEIDLLKVIEAAHQAAVSTPGVKEATTSHAFSTGKITTEVIVTGPRSAPQVVDDVKKDSASRIRNAVGVRAAESGIETAVSVSQASSLGGLESSSYHYGGELITGCTSGFGTRASSSTSGTRGISTAAHCQPPLSDDGSALTSQAAHEGTHGDFRWLVGPNTEADDFYSGSDTSTEVNLRDVSAIGAPVTGQSLCRNGRSTQKHCQTVNNLNVCHGSACNLVQMESHLSTGGDSGGPVFWGNTAYGIHRGFKTTGIWPFQTEREVFSRADRIDNALGIYIATN